MTEEEFRKFQEEYVGKILAAINKERTTVAPEKYNYPRQEAGRAEEAKTDKRPIDVALDTLEKELECLYKELTNLDERLYPVSGCIPKEEKCMGSPQNSPNSSKLSVRLTTLTELVKVSRSKIDYMVHALEI